VIKFTKWDVVFVDEVHKLKGGCNSTPTAIWTEMKEVCRNARFMYFLSGTPIVNKAEEMWSYLHLFAPEQFPSVKNFLHKFTDASYGDNGNVTFKVNVNRLLNALEGQMIHRTKAEVAADLPDMDAEFIYLEMDGEQLKFYEQMRDNFFVMLDSKAAQGGEKAMLSATVIIAHLNRLRQIALAPRSLKLTDKETGEVWQLPASVNSAKLDHAMDLIEEIDDQVVVFSSQFNAPLEELGERLSAAGKTWRIIDGDHSRYSQEYEEDFQQQKFDVLLINMRTGTEGLNLQKCADWPGGASYAIMLDLWWNPAMNDQAMMRLHRMNTSEPVMIYILQCEDSVDAYVKAIVQDKEGLINPLMSDSRLRPASEWRELLEGLV
jgi:SNF2 family DNA or RNA helicase